SRLFRLPSSMKLFLACCLFGVVWSGGSTDAKMDDEPSSFSLYYSSKVVQDGKTMKQLMHDIAAQLAPSDGSLSSTPPADVAKILCETQGGDKALLRWAHEFMKVNTATMPSPGSSQVRNQTTTAPEETINEVILNKMKTTKESTCSTAAQNEVVKCLCGKNGKDEWCYYIGLGKELINGGFIVCDGDKSKFVEGAKIVRDKDGKFPSSSSHFSLTLLTSLSCLFVLLLH
ncbi:hypothetical protein PFISCL1PPCAC_267, partial [Pristionchus fissidentatus]